MTCRHHDWTHLTSDETHWVCGDCETVTPACGTCMKQPGRPTGTDLPICRACHTYWGGLLAETETAANLITDVTATLTGLRATRYDLATATTATSPLPFGLEPLLVDTFNGGRPTTPTGALDALGEVADEWRDKGATGINGWRDLRGHLVWAATHLDHDTWTTSLDTIRAATGLIRRITGYTTTPTGLPCLECGGPLIRDHTETGIALDAHCQTCRLDYTPGQYSMARLAKIQTAPDASPDALITEKQARRVFPTLPPGVLRVWAQRHHLTRHGVDRSGEYLYRVGDIHARLTGDSAGA